MHFLCMQETHRADADSFVTDGQSLVILSGGDLKSREFAGVGFIIIGGYTLATA